MMFLLVASTPDFHRKEDVLLQWKGDTPVELPTDSLTMPQFQLRNISVRECRELYKTGKVHTYCTVPVYCYPKYI